MRFKILILFFLALGMIEHSAYSQTADAELRRADSLFSIRKYTQSYELYDSMYQKGYSSDQMLLKMAYIQEGLGDYTMALFHLNNYYIRSSDERALAKMQSLGEQHNLVGYEYSETDFIISVYHEYYNVIIIVLSLLSVVFFAGLLYKKYKRKEKPVFNYVIFSILAIALVIVINTGMGYKEAIVTHSDTYVMSGPSSSSEVIAVVSKGNKVPIKRSKDVWLQTEWDDRIAYVKSKNVTPIPTW